MTAIRERGDLALRLLEECTRLSAYLCEDTDVLDRWERLFRDEIDTCFRARNNITTGARISLRNLRAAAEMASCLARLAEMVDVHEEVQTWES